MYRVAKRTTKGTRGYCLNCNHCKVLRQYPQPYGTIVECTEKNRCIFTEFNTNDFYCVEYKGLNDFSNFERNEMAQKARENYYRKVSK